MNDQAFIYKMFASYQRTLQADLNKGVIDKRAYYSRLQKARENRDNLIKNL